MSDTREAVRAHVDRHPGVHFRAIVRQLELAPGQAQYHLRQLREADRVVCEEYGGRTHFFAPDHDATARRQLAVLRRETARDVVLALAATAPARPGAVADDLGVARSTLEWHLDRLVAEGLVEKRRSAGRVELALADPDLVGRRLEAVGPSVPERLVDRFTRLVDGLLCED